MSIEPAEFFNELKRQEINFFTGVPDSLLKDFCTYIDKNVSSKKHIIAANEGNATSIAAGYYLATGKIPLVYMQNSGFGNAINPLLSLCDPDIYSIPMTLLIGWRGEPGVDDAVQHKKDGRIQCQLQDALEIPYETFDQNTKNYAVKIKKGIETSEKEKRPFIFLIKKGTFQKISASVPSAENETMTREEALEVVLESFNGAHFISTTGKTSRELYEIRDKRGETHDKDFLVVGSMGHCSSIALGLALEKPDKDIICIDGDGAFLMHMGSIAIIGAQKPSNLKHIIINNGAHESVGGQPTVAKKLDIGSIVRACGYQSSFKVGSKEQLREQINEFKNCTGPSLLEILVNKKSRKDLGRPSTNLKDIKNSFSKSLQQSPCLK